jgi:hypothetical protein
MRELVGASHTLALVRVSDTRLDVIENLVHSKGDLKVNLKDMACILLLEFRTIEQTPISWKLEMGLEESKAKEDGVRFNQVRVYLQ